MVAARQAVRGPAHGGRDDRGGAGRPDTLRAPPTAQAFSGAHTLGICQGGAASAGEHDPDRACPRPSCPGRRSLGLPVSSHNPSAPATAPGKAPDSAPGHPLAGPGPPRHTVAPAHGPRQHAPQVVGAMARALSACMWAMAKQVGAPPKASRWRRLDTQACDVANLYRQRRRPGVVSPSAALGGQQVLLSLD